MKKIAVLMGGTSSEREVSLMSGKNIAEALASLGKYEVESVVLDEDSLDALPKGVDAVYIALHGGWGENGGVQEALDRLAIPYTGPGANASRIAMDKVKTKLVLEYAGVKTAKWSLAEKDAKESPLPLPVVVKPPCDGSSVGISKVSKAEDWPRAVAEALKAQGGEGSVLVEEFIPGREMTVGIIDSHPLPAIEIVTKSGWYGYDEKYFSEETRYPFLADSANPADRRLEVELKAVALAAYKACGARGVARVDFRVAPDGGIYVLELNTSPGFTSHSLVPKSAMREGKTFAEVCDSILSIATCDKR